MTILYCPTCQTWTNHVLIKSGTAYVCVCGCEQKILRQVPLITAAESEKG